MPVGTPPFTIIGRLQTKQAVYRQALTASFLAQSMCDVVEISIAIQITFRKVVQNWRRFRQRAQRAVMCSMAQAAGFRDTANQTIPALHTAMACTYTHISTYTHMYTYYI